MLLVERLEERTLPSAAGALQQAYGQLPLSFEVNDGQTASQVKYLSQGNGYALFLTEDSAVLSLLQPAGGTAGTLPPASSAGVALAMNLVGANSNATVSGLDRQAGVSNYFIGNNSSQWRSNVANYGEVEYQNVYSGINLVYLGNQQQLEYDFVVAPGANPGNIKLDFQGAQSISLDAQGDLVLHTATGNVLQKAPVIYQEVDGSRKMVAGKFVIGPHDEVGFQLGAYNKSLPLTIDPVLSYSTFLGGSGDDFGYGIAVDSSGDAYVTGYTDSTDFPTTMGAFQANLGGQTNAFVTKLNASGTAVVYSTDLGGSLSDYGLSIAVDSSDNAYITGSTDSTNFPTTLGAFQASLAGSNNAFVTELSASGALVYSTYLGGSRFDTGYGIAVNGSGNAYVTGVTDSTNFPTTSGAIQTSLAGDSNAFVTEVSADGASLVYSTYLGGSNDDRGNGIALDASGDAYVTGATDSTDFPTTAGAFQTSYGGGAKNAFVTKISADGASLVYSTYLGGDAFDQGNGIAVDASGDAYVTGFTDSANFPTTAGAFQTTLGGGADAFVTKLDDDGAAMVYSTYLGGSSNDEGNAIAVDSAGDAYITGFSESTDFPTTANAYQTSLGGASNTFVTKLFPSGAALAYSTYVGGNDLDFGQAIAVNGANAFVTGIAYSNNFPTTSNAFQTSFGGDEDAFVADFDLPSPTITSININAGTVPILRASESGSTATFTTDGASGFAAGDPVVIAGVGGGYDGTYTIASVNTGNNSFAVNFGSNTGLATITGAGTAIDTAQTGGPLVNGTATGSGNEGSASYNSQRSMVDSIVYKFNVAVTLAANAFTISVLGEGGQAPTVSYASPDGGTTWVVTFSGNGVVGNSIANGEYQIVLNASAVSAVTGWGTLASNDTESFYRLYGNIGGSESVGTAANRAFDGTFGLTAAQAGYLAYFDYNDGGSIGTVANRHFDSDFGVSYSGFTPTI